MSNPDFERFRGIKTFPSLVKYLRDDLDWPIESEHFDDLTFDFEPEELGIDLRTSAKIESIKQLRPLTSNQPWGIFFVKFEPKKLPVVALRRILGQLVIKKRASANRANQQTWRLSDLLFLSNYGENEQRQITFAHFSGNSDSKNLPTLKVLGWDDSDTALHIDHAHSTLRDKLRWPDDENNLDAWRKAWSSAFILRHREVIDTSKKLAIKLAGLAQKIRKRANSILSIETEMGPLQNLMLGFKEGLIHDLTEDSFADMYAQTIAYGLLSARITNPKGNNPDELSSQMPITNPFLKELMESFLSVGGRKGKSGMGVGIDFDELGINEVVDLLDNSDMEAVIRDFGDKNPLEDPVIHFYELFLHEYDSKIKMQRGVFYTPRPVVSFIVRSVDEILRTEFGLGDGLADTATWGEMVKRNKEHKIPKGAKSDDPFVQILDPATGTGTFLVEAIDFIHKTMVEKWEDEGNSEKKIERLWNDYVPKYLLPRLHGYELLMAPYAIAHMKVGLKLRETGYSFGSDERTQIYLTNALEPPSDTQRRLAGILPALAHEAEAVNKVKLNRRFTVIIGNPPYAGHSPNQGAWIRDLGKEYFEVDGQKINEANSKWLQDDYVKFIRLGQHTLEKTGRGLQSYISNHGYIDNPTFRGMRQSLLYAFNQLLVLDLNGNLKKKTRANDGSADKNVFDIQQGVAIFVGVRNPSTRACSVYHDQLKGSREKKYQYLDQNQILSLATKLVAPKPPFFLLIPQDVSLQHEYEEFEGLSGNLLEHSLGILSKRDALVVGFSGEDVLSKMTKFTNMQISNETVADLFGLPIADKDKWVMENSRTALGKASSSFIRKLMYRPFDFRYIYYHPAVVARMNNRVMRHLSPERENIGLIFGRQGMATGSVTWDVCFVTNTLCDQNIFRRGGGTVFPVLLFEEGESVLIPSTDSNLSGELGKNCDALNTTPQEMACYAYAVLNAPAYRSRYAEFLKMDFPRLPLTESLELFRELARLGGDLVALHLMEYPNLDDHITTIVGTSEFLVEKISYSDKTVWINKIKSRGFQGIPEEVWNFHIGGYQVCDKWLKDRGPKKGKPGRVLTKEDIAHYQKIIVAISETIRIMAEIDGVIEKHGGWPSAFTPE